MRGHMGDSCPQQEDIKGKLGFHHMLRNKDIMYIKTYLKTLKDEINNIFCLLGESEKLTKKTKKLLQKMKRTWV